MSKWIFAVVLCGCADVRWSDGDAESTDVVAIDWSSFGDAIPDDDNAQRMRAILARSNKYALTTWYAGRDLDDLGGTGEHEIRPVASEALALAVSLRLGAYDAGVTEVPVAVAEQRTVQLVASVAASHRSNRDGGWGGGWQTALWAAYAGTAGWLLWDWLPATEARHVARMVESEARRLVGYRVPYFRDADDNVVSPGDSKAEENAWNAQLLYLAINMMPNDPQVSAWEFKAAELAISSYAKPSDARSSTRINGRSLAQWLQGSNANSDATVINHDIVHPDYIFTAAYTASAPLWYGMRRQPTPDAMFAGVAAAYAVLADKSWIPGAGYPGTACTATCACDADDRCVASDPGGAIYVANSAEIYFPHGNDWGTGRKMHFAMFDSIAHDFELGPQAAQWELRHADAAYQQQLVSQDGRMYLEDEQDTYRGREEWVAVHAALAWFGKYIAAHGAYARTDRALDIVVDNFDRDLLIEGEWESVTTAQDLGDDSLRTTATRAVHGARLIWRPRLAPGTYRVDAWWPSDPSLTTRASYTIGRGGKAERIDVDQRSDGNRWVSLGTFTFGSIAAVELAAPEADGALAADGLRFRRVDSSNGS